MDGGRSTKEPARIANLRKRLHRIEQPTGPPSRAMASPLETAYGGVTDGRVAVGEGRVE